MVYLSSVLDRNENLEQSWNSSFSAAIINHARRCYINKYNRLQAAGLDLKAENLGAGAAAAWPYPSVYHPYDAAFASYPFNG